jgi:hypothetical protein
MHDLLQLENMSDSWVFWCLQALRDYELGNQLWSVQATISAKVTQHPWVFMKPSSTLQRVTKSLGQWEPKGR